MVGADAVAREPELAAARDENRERRERGRREQEIEEQDRERSYRKAMLIESLDISSGASGTSICSGVGPTRAASGASLSRSKP